jgi:ribose transport system substrate-binding protein
LEKFKQNPIVKKLGFNRIILMGVLILLYLIFCAVVKDFAGSSHLMGTLNYVYFLGFLSLGVTFVIATGGIDFSIGPVMFCCALISGYCFGTYHFPMWLALILCIFVGFLFGLFNGYLVAYWSVPPFIVSMASMNIAKGVASVFTKTQSVSWPRNTDAKAELGVDYTAQGPNSESDIADQVNMLNSAISGKPNGIALAACDTTSVLDSLQQAKDAGIPVVCFDTGVADAPDGSVVATVATDNGKAGALAADKMYEILKDKIGSSTKQVRIGEVNQDATALNIQQRGLGFINELIKVATADGKTVAVSGNEFYVNAAEGANGDEASANIVIEVAVPAQTTVDLCSTEASKIMSKSDTIGIFGSNQTSAEGVLAANNNLGVLNSDPSKGMIGIGFDAGSVIKGAITDGTMAGAVTQSPLLMGYYAIYAMTMAANGDKVSDFPMDGYWYDSTNMTDPQIAPNLYD